MPVWLYHIVERYGWGPPVGGAVMLALAGFVLLSWWQEQGRWPR